MPITISAPEFGIYNLPVTEIYYTESKPMSYTFFVEETDPELETEMQNLRISWFEKTGRPGFRIKETIFSDIDMAVERARALHGEGIPVKIYVRFLDKN